MGTLKHLCIGLALLAQGYAQPGISPSPAGQAPVKDAAATPADAVKPARFVATDDLDPYLKSMVSRFQAMSREKDPFGQYQDPDAKPVVPVTPQGIARRAAVKATPLSEIVSRLDVTTIMPGERSFLIGTRKVRVGQQLPLVWRGKPLRVQVTEVSSTRIAFRDLESGETGARTMDILPVGMSIGNGLKEITAPGMVPDRPDAPIEVGGGDVTMTP